MTDSAHRSQPSEPGTPERESAQPPGDALRSAVERTLAATAGSAAGTRQRAKDLLDEVSRRGEVARGELARRGEAARDEVARRSEAARDEVARVGEEAGARLSEAIADLRHSSSEDLSRIGERIGVLEERLAAIERALRGQAATDEQPRERQAENPHSQAPEAGQAKAQPEVENSPGNPAESEPQGG